MRVIIIEPNQSEKLDNVLSEHDSFVRFHSPNCGHCVAMKDEMEKLKGHSELKYIDELNLIDAHTGVTQHSNHPVCKMHNGAVPAMYMIIKGQEPQEYEGDRNADAMARFIREKIGGYSKKKGGKKRKTRKHKKKAKKAHKKKTHKRKPKRKTRKPKRKTRKHKKKAKKAHKKKTHKRRNVRHSTRKKGGREPHWYQAKRDEYGQEKDDGADFVPPDGQGQGRGGEIASHQPAAPCCGNCGSFCTSLTCGHSMCPTCGFDGEPTDQKMYCMTPQEIANDKRKRELYRKYQ